MRRPAILALALALALGGVALTTPAALAGDVTSSETRSASTCDASGDGSADDCIRHHNHRDAADHLLEGDERLSVRVDLHPALHGTSLRTQVQIRPLTAKGKPTGAWATAGSFSWEAKPAAGGTVRKVFSVCAPQKPGLYQVRKLIEVPKAQTRMATRTQAPYTSAPSTVAANGLGCTNSPDDETNVEYFNEINFETLYELSFTQDANGNFKVLLLCPPRLTPELPPQSLDVLLQTWDTSSSTSCFDQVPIVLEMGKGGCDDRGVCSLIVLARNNVTSVVYSQTYLKITLESDQYSWTIIPALNSATLPICNDVVDPCVVEETCSLSTEKEGSLQLCESASTCSDPLAVKQPGSDFSYDSNVYFQVAVKDLSTS